MADSPEDARVPGPEASPDATGTPAAASSMASRSRLLVGLAVAALFAVIIAVNVIGGQAPPSARDGAGQSAQVPDPVATLDAAVGGDTPIYVLFHSSSCAPCVEIEQVAARVLPDYEGRIVYVDAPTDDSRTGPLFARFSFQYIPTSFFVTPAGEIADSYTGVLSDDEMRQRLDALLSAAE